MGITSQIHTTHNTTAPRGLLTLAFSATLTIGLYDGATGVLLPSLQSFYHVGKGVERVEIRGGDR